MISEEKINNAIAAFSQNPYWKREYDEAPTEVCRERVALSFYYSCNVGKMTDKDKEEYIAECRKLEEQFGIEDWKHELRFCGHNPLRSVYARKIAELSEKQE